MPHLHLHLEKHWEMAQDRLKRELRDLPSLFQLEHSSLDSLKHTLELSRHLFTILLVWEKRKTLERIYFWRPGFFWQLWEEEVNLILADVQNFDWGSFWKDAHI